MIDDEAKDMLGNLGYDPIYGARPLKRVIQKHLENPLAEQILSGKFLPGDTVHVGAANGELKIERKPGTPRTGRRRPKLRARCRNARMEYTAEGQHEGTKAGRF